MTVSNDWPIAVTVRDEPAVTKDLMTIDQFLEMAGITGKVTEGNGEIPSGFHPASCHWVTTLRRNDRRMRVNCYTGPAIHDEPTIGEVLAAVADEVRSLEDTSDLCEWAMELGYDAWDREAIKVYGRLKRMAGRLKRFLGSDLYEKLLWETDTCL